MDISWLRKVDIVPELIDIFTFSRCQSSVLLLEVYYLLVIQYL